MRSAWEIIPPAQHLGVHPAQQLGPVVLADQHDREVHDRPGLDQRQRLEQLVEGAEAAGEDHEAHRRLHEHRLARVEVLEAEPEVDVRVHPLLVRQLDVEADGEPAALLAAAVPGLHHARAAAGDDREALLREEARRLARGFVGLAARLHPGRAEEGHGRPVDPLDRLEAAQELVPDRVEVLFLDAQCGTWVAAIPSTSAAARPR